MWALFKKYCQVEGRAPRREYIYFSLTMVVMFAAAFFVAQIVSNLTGGGMAGMFYFLIINSIVGLILLIPGLATVIRRLHDHNLSGYYILLPVAVGFIFSIVFMNAHDTMRMASGLFNLVVAIFLMGVRGTVGPNKYGADPIPESKI